MNKDKLKESFLKKWNSASNVRRNPEHIWSWITSNFISKEELREKIKKTPDIGVISIETDKIPVILRSEIIKLIEK